MTEEEKFKLEYCRGLICLMGEHIIKYTHETEANETRQELELHLAFIDGKINFDELAKKSI